MASCRGLELTEYETAKAVNPEGRRAGSTPAQDAMTGTITSLAPFPYMGGKSRCLDWLYGHMPRQIDHIVDVFGGAGNVVLGCGFARMRTYNDLNGDLVNFFRVLRSNADDLIRLIELTPHSRSEYKQAFVRSDDEIERARQVFIMLSQSFGRTQTKSGFSVTPRNGRFGVSESTFKFLKKVEGLPAVVNALRQVTIENLPYEELLEKYACEQVYFYLDPPYLSRVRTSGVKYANELSTEESHKELVIRLNALMCQGFMLSCYDDPVYEELKGVKKSNKRIQVNGGAGTRLETIFYTPTEQGQSSLF